MTINELIRDLQQLAATSVKGGDCEVVLYDRTSERELRVDADADRFDFEVTRGDGELVIEFN